MLRQSIALSAAALLIAVAPTDARADEHEHATPPPPPKVRKPDVHQIKIVRTDDGEEHVIRIERDRVIEREHEMRRVEEHMHALEMPRGAMPQPDHLLEHADAIDLTDEQVAELHNLRTAHRKMELEANYKRELAQIELEYLAQMKAPDLGALAEAFAAVAQSEAAAQIIPFRIAGETRDVLTEAQLARVDDMLLELREHARHMRSDIEHEVMMEMHGRFGDDPRMRIKRRAVRELHEHEDDDDGHWERDHDEEHKADRDQDHDDDDDDE